LLIDEPLANLPVVDNYRWNRWASEEPLVAVLVWWLVVTLLGWLAWPLCFALFAPWLDRGYLFSRTVGWLLAGWLLWMFAGAGWLHNTVVNSWLMVGVLAIAGGLCAWRQAAAIRQFVAARWSLLLAEEALFAAAFTFFIFIRMVNPDLWQPWLGGEKFMEFAFLNGVLRSPVFPPVDPHFAGGYINYYYFGLYLVGYLIKLTGIYAEVAFNLTIALLFALTVANAFAITHTAWALWRGTQAWQRGMMTALLGPLLVALIGNLDGYGQIVRQLSERSPLQLQSALPGVSWLVESVVGLMQVAAGKTTLPPYDFWAPSRVIPATINEFPYWSFLFADLHPHLIGIPLSLLFLGALFNLVLRYRDLWAWGGIGPAVVGSLIFLLGALISVNLWELPTYLGLAILTLLLCDYRYFGSLHLGRVAGSSVVLLTGAIVLYLPFFRNFVNVGASGIGLVQQGDDLGQWLLLWGGLGFLVVSWLLWRSANAGLPRVMRARRAPVPVVQTSTLSADEPAIENAALAAEESLLDEPFEDGDASGEVASRRSSSEASPNIYTRAVSQHAAAPSRSGVSRLVGMAMRHFDRLPRLWYLHRLLVTQPTLNYLLGVASVPTLFALAVVAWLLDRSVLALCLAVLAFSLPLLWRRESEADSADHLATILAVTGVAILAGTQVFYLKDFLQGGEYYRMNTLFKFFNQVWVLWAVAAAIALPRLWAAAWAGLGERAVRLHGAAPAEDLVPDETPDETITDETMAGEGAEAHTAAWRPLPRTLGFGRRGWGLLWRLACVLILVACGVYIIFGTPARLSQRFVGWIPPFGTLNGMAYMQQGRYAWPNDSNWIELSYDYDAIQWLLNHVRGNVVIVESADVDYYRVGGTRVASMTGLSGLRGAHVSEQRYGEQVGARDGLHREFWSSMSVERTEALIAQLQISLIYAGQLERYIHPEGVQKLAKMASEGRLDVLYENDGVVIYAVPNTLALSEGGWYVPVPQAMPQAVPLPLPSMGAQSSGSPPIPETS
jgi:uncharacterized membrane protein